MSHDTCVLCRERVADGAWAAHRRSAHHTAERAACALRRTGYAALNGALDAMGVGVVTEQHALWHERLVHLLRVGGVHTRVRCTGTRPNAAGDGLVLARHLWAPTWALHVAVCVAALHSGAEARALALGALHVLAHDAEARTALSALVCATPLPDVVQAVCAFAAGLCDRRNSGLRMHPSRLLP